jgi:prepilin-type N-terminal cleavage/methylation domain-containing protein
MHAKSHRAQAGFTLIELMVVVVIVTVLVATATLALRPERYARNAKGYTEQVASTLENMRLRATASRRWQRLEVNGDSIVHMEADAPGMGVPAGYNVITTVEVPSGVRIAALDDSTHDVPDVAVADGTGLGDFIDFAPDGAGQAATIFIEDETKRQYRVAVFRATAAAQVYEGW